MITLLRSSQRHHVKHDKHEVWHSHAVEHCFGLNDIGVGSLVAFDELVLLPGADAESHCEKQTEIVTYVYRGALSQADTPGSSMVIGTGEFQRMSIDKHIRHKETSASRTDSVHLFRVSLRPAHNGLDSGHELKRFTEAQRRNLLCIVVSPTGCKGSLRIHQDVLIYSAVIDPGYHIIHELAPGRTVWLHTVCGVATLNDIVLTQGDGVGVTDERSVSLTVQDDAEIILIDMGPASKRPWD